MLFPLATGRVFTKDDLGALHLPLRHLYQEALRAGEFLLWTPAYHSGFNIHGAGEAGMAHPLHLLLYALLPLGVAFNLEIISSYVFMFAGSGLLLRRLGLSREAAWFGALTFAFCAFSIYNAMHVNHIATLAHAPWLLLGQHVLVTTNDPRSRALAFAGVALTSGSQMLMGNPQYVWLTAVAVVFMTGGLLWSSRSIARILLYFAAVAFGGLIAAIQLLPSLDFLADSSRAAWTMEFATSFSLSPLNLIQLWSPFAFQFRVAAPPAEEFIVHEFIVFNGAFATVALAWIAIRWRELDHRGLLIGLLLFAAVGLLLAFGRYGGLYPAIAWMPVLRAFRAPARHIVLVQMALSGIAAIAIEDLINMSRQRDRVPARQLWPLGVLILLSVVTTAAAAVLSGSQWAAENGLRFSGILRAAPWAAMVIVVAVFVAMAARGMQWMVPIVIVSAAFTQAVWGYSGFYRWNPIRSLTELRSEAQVPPGAKPGDLIPPLWAGRDQLAILRGLRLTTGYSGLMPASRLDHAAPAVERLAGINWRGDGDRWTAVTDSMPKARLVAQARTSTDVGSDVQHVNVAETALVDRALDLSGTPGMARVLVDRPGRLEVDTVADGRQLLVLTERFNDGWRIRVDDSVVQPVRVYGDFLGCVIERGNHHVVLEFRPASVQTGWYLSGLGLALTLITSTMLRVRRVPLMIL